MARTTSISRRTITVKRRNDALPKAPSSGSGRESLYPATSLGVPKRRMKKWWQKPEVLFAIATAAIVIAGLSYIGLTAKPNTGYPQDDYFVSGGSYGDTAGTEGRNRGSTTQDRGLSDQGFLAFARAQHARSEASRAAHARRQAAR